MARLVAQIIEEVEKTEPVCAAVCKTLVACSQMGVDDHLGQTEALVGPMRRLGKPELSAKQSNGIIRSFSRNCIQFVLKHADNHTHPNGSFECSEEDLRHEARWAAREFQQEWRMLL